MKWPIIGLIGILLMVLGACATPEAPEAAVERYLQAKVEGDIDTMRGLLCAEMEADLDREAHTFDTVTGVTIEGMECESSAANTVTCSGEIVASYGAENTTFPLETYRVVQEDGIWKWCGEA